MRLRPAASASVARQKATQPQVGQKWNSISRSPRRYARVGPETRMPSPSQSYAQSTP